MFLAEQHDDDLADGRVGLAGRRGSLPRVPRSSRQLERSSELARLLEGSGCENETHVHDTSHLLQAPWNYSCRNAEPFFDGIDDELFENV